MLEKIKKEFTWGTITNTHIIGNEYTIIEYVSSDNKTTYKPYINFRDTHYSFDSLDQAIIYVIALKRLQDPNEAKYAANFFMKMSNNK